MEVRIPFLLRNFQTLTISRTSCKNFLAIHPPMAQLVASKLDPGATIKAIHMARVVAAVVVILDLGHANRPERLHRGSEIVKIVVVVVVVAMNTVTVAPRTLLGLHKTEEAIHMEAMAVRLGRRQGRIRQPLRGKPKLPLVDKATIMAATRATMLKLVMLLPRQLLRVSALSYSNMEERRLPLRTLTLLLHHLMGNHHHLLAWVIMSHLHRPLRNSLGWTEQRLLSAWSY